MTRINCVDPSELSIIHLVAEYRELPRVFNLVRKAIDRGSLPIDFSNPNEYVLGPGHVKFFYTRLMFLKKRQDLLIAEGLNRGLNLSYTDTSMLLANIPKEWCKDWKPTHEAIELNRARIRERTSK